MQRETEVEIFVLDVLETKEHLMKTRRSILGVTHQMGHKKIQ